MTEPIVTAKQMRAALRDGEYDKAMPVLETMLRRNPNDAPAHWHLSSCLMAFDREEEALAAVKRVLEINPRFAPAWLRHAQLSATLDEEYPDFERDLMQAVDADPDSVEAIQSLAEHYRGTERDAEANTLLDQALARKPNAALLHQRAHWRMSDAYTVGPGETPIQQFNSMVLSKEKLEAALADLNAALALEPQTRQYLGRRANILHQLQRYDEALADWDALLATVEAGTPEHQAYLEMRRRSENQGAGEREQTADFLSNIVDGLSDKERDSLTGDMMTSIVRSSQLAIRQGKTLEQALTQFASDDPLDIAATNIAYQIYTVGNEAAPVYVESVLSSYPRAQRRYAASALKQMQKAGFDLIGDYEPLHLRETLGKPTLVRIYAGDDDASFAASYRISPKWPGLLGYLFMRLTGKWHTPSVIELESALSDGHFIITNNAGEVSPFGYGGNIDICKLPLNTAISKVVAQHRQRMEEYLATHPGVTPRRAQSFEKISALLLQLSEAKNQYRKFVNYITDAEMHKMLGAQYDKLAPRIRSRLNALTAT